MTSFLPLWVKVASYLQEETNCATKLANGAFVRGFSEGGKTIVINTTSSMHTVR